MGVTQDVNICGIFSQKLPLTACYDFEYVKYSTRFGFFTGRNVFHYKKKDSCADVFLGEQVLNLE